MIIWRFTDGKLGHENQTSGLVDALHALQQDITVFDISISTLPSSRMLLLKAMLR